MNLNAKSTSSNVVWDGIEARKKCLRNSFEGAETNLLVSKNSEPLTQSKYNANVQTNRKPIKSKPFRSRTRLFGAFGIFDNIYIDQVRLNQDKRFIKHTSRRLEYTSSDIYNDEYNKSHWDSCLECLVCRFKYNSFVNSFCLTVYLYPSHVKSEYLVFTLTFPYSNR